MESQTGGEKRAEVRSELAATAVVAELPAPDRRSGTGTPSEMSAFVYDVFLLHAEGDEAFVNGYLLAGLALPPARVLTPAQLSAGRPTLSELERGVRTSRVTIVVLSPAFLVAQWAVVGEHLAAYAAITDGERGQLLPLWLDDCELPAHLQMLEKLDFRDRDRAVWDDELARLRRQLARPPAPADDVVCPYPGLRAYAIDDPCPFFGRDREIDELVGRIDRGEREIYVIGPSGSGKSSLVQAGLLAVLRAGSSRLGRSCAVLSMRPGERPVERLAKLLETTPAALRETPVGVIGAAIARAPAAERAVIFIDQLEELFTNAHGEDRDAMMAALRALRREPRCVLIFALRADFFGTLLDSELGAELAGRLTPVVVAPLRGDALAEAIRGPAQRAGVHLEPRLCDRLIADAADQPGVLPLLQETLRVLWDRRQQRWIGLAAYEALGGERTGEPYGLLTVAIARRADTMWNALAPAQQTIARRVLLRLVSFSDGRVETRRQQEVAALAPAADDPSALAGVLAALVASRLVVIGGDPADNDAVADLSHDALIAGWPALREWIRARRADGHTRLRLDDKAAEWVARGRGDASLLDPVELAEAEHWMASDAARELGYGADLAGLVHASRCARDGFARRRRRRIRASFAALAAFAVVVAILGLVAWRRGEDTAAQARLAERRLAVAALEQGRGLLVDGHPMQALPYLVEARANGLDGPVLGLLFGQAAKLLPRISLVGHTGSLNDAAWSPNGRRVVTAGDDGTARIWDPATSEQVVPPLQHGDYVSRAAFSPDGTHVVTASADHTARIWDAATGAPVSRPFVHPDKLIRVVYSPDGERIATVCMDGTARIWNVATGAQVGLPIQHRTMILQVTFSPDSTLLLTAGNDSAAYLWDAQTGERRASLAHEENKPVQSAAFSADGTRVVTASFEGTARVWEVATGEPSSPPFGRGGRLWSTGFTADGLHVFTAGDSGVQIWRWDRRIGPYVVAAFLDGAWVASAELSPDGKRLVTLSEDDVVNVWDIATKLRIAGPFEHSASVSPPSFRDDGTRILTASDDGVVRVWDAEPAKRRQFRDVGSLLHAFDPTGRHLLLNHWGEVRLWDIERDAPSGPPLEHDIRVSGARFTADGRRLMTVADNRVVRLWDVATARPLTPPIAQEPTARAAVSADGRRLATGGGDGVARVWDGDTGRPLTPPLVHGGQIKAVALSADGRWLATASETTVRIWDAASGAPGPTLAHRARVVSVELAPSGRRVVTASGHTVQVWDAALGIPVLPPLVHRGDVVSAAFTGDGAQIITNSDGAVVQLWDAATGEPAAPQVKHRRQVLYAQTSADGTQLLTGGNPSAWLWDAATGKPLASLIEDTNRFLAVAFGRAQTAVLMSSRGMGAELWSLPIDHRPLADWRALARCAPFALVDGVLVEQRDPARVCPNP